LALTVNETNWVASSVQILDAGRPTLKETTFVGSAAFATLGSLVESAALWMNNRSGKRPFGKLLFSSYEHP